MHTTFTAPPEPHGSARRDHPSSPPTIRRRRSVGSSRAAERRYPLSALLLLFLPLAVPRAQPLAAQDRPASTLATDTLTLADARARARQLSPDLVAAREAVAAAAGRVRQAGAFANPVVSYDREQTSAAGATNAQNIVTLQQPLEFTGQRSLRRDIASAERAAAEARLAAAEARLDLEVTRAWARAAAAESRAGLVERIAGAFTSAQRVGQARLAGGDISGYEARRLRLEVARYAAVRAEALATRSVSRATLAALVTETGALPNDILLAAAAARVPARVTVAVDSLLPIAETQRPELRAATLEAGAADVSARLAARERVPVPVAIVGYKNERAAGVAGQLSGLVAGVSLPVPVWDRREGAIAAAGAEARRRTALVEATRREIAREVREAYAAHQALAGQVTLLREVLDQETAAVLRSAQVAYTEGEMTLVEWLDAVRAAYEAETSYATLWADYITSRAALERAVGVSLP